MSKKLIGAVAASACFLLSSATHALPVVYDFTGGRVIGSGSVASLNPSLLLSSVSGSFTWDPDGEYYGQGNAGTASVYKANGNLSLTLNVLGPAPASYSLFDELGIVAIANDLYNRVDPTSPTGFTPVVGVDLIEAYYGPMFGAWTPFTLGGQEVTRVRMGWVEGGANSNPDFLSNENVPSLLPTFPGFLSIDFGSTGTGPATGVLSVQGFKITARPVPEPTTAILLVIGLVGLSLRRVLTHELSRFRR